MPDEKSSDVEIIARERRSYRRGLALFPVGLLLALAVMAGFSWAQDSGFVPKWFSESALEPITLALVISLLIVLAFRIFARPPKEAMSERILRKQIDDHQKRWRFLYILIAIMAIVLGTLPLSPHFRSPGVNSTLWLPHASFVFVALMSALIICFGPGFLNASFRNAMNDELTRALRARASRLGFLIAVAGMGASYLVALYKPEWSVFVLSPVIAAAIAVPALYFVILDWRAGRNSAAAGRDET